MDIDRDGLHPTEQSPEQIALNKRLYDAVTAEPLDLAAVEELLKLGADPLGSLTTDDPTEHLLGELFCEMSYNETASEKLPQIVRLFLDHGMSIASSGIPPEDGDNINPLWELAFLDDRSGWETLKVLPESGLDAEYVETLPDHLLTDMQVEDMDMSEEWQREYANAALKMPLCAASYPHVLDNSEYIRKWSNYDMNDAANLPIFRDWDAYEWHIGEVSGETSATRKLTFVATDIQTHSVLWTARL